jgi:predicted RND superfamily exporter protein
MNIPIAPILMLVATLAIVCATVALRPAIAGRSRWAAVPAVLGVSIAAASALYNPSTSEWRIALDPSEEPMLPSDDPGLAAYHNAVANFGDDDLFVIAMQTDDIFTHDNLATLRAAGDRIRRVVGVRSVESIVDTAVPSYDEERDLFAVGNFVEEIPSAPDALARLRIDALEHPLFSKSLLGPQGRTAAINVAMRSLSDQEYVRAGINEQIRAILDEYESENRRFFVTGRQHIKAAAYHIMVHDMLLLIPVALFVGALVAWAATGSSLTGLVPVGASTLAMLWVFGYLALTGASLNIITLVLGPVLLCVGSVYGVHVIAQFQRTTPAVGRHAVTLCVERTRAPVVLAGVTTIIGFAALATSATPAIRELAALAVLGIAAVTTISLAALPAAVSFAPAALRTGGEPGSGLPAMIDQVIQLCRRLALVHSRATIGLWLALGLTAAAALPSITVDTDYLSFFDRSSRIRTDFTTIGETLVGPVPIYVSVHTANPGAMREPENLHALSRLQDLIDRIPSVAATLSAVDLVKQTNRALEYDDPKAAVIPESKGKVADVFFLIPKARMRPFANANQSSANIIVRTSGSGSAAIRQLETELLQAIDDAGLPGGLRAEVTGSSILMNHTADDIASDQFTAVGAATFAIFVLVTLAMRSLKLGALAMVPNIVPVLIFFGLLGAGLGALSLPTSLLGCIALGIAVDDTAHFLVGYHRLRTAGFDCAAAAAQCIETLGRPIVVTSLMLIAGFLVLGLSGFATLRELGRLGALTMFICMCADLTLLPALLVRARA